MEKFRGEVPGKMSPQEDTLEESDENELAELGVPKEKIKEYNLAFDFYEMSTDIAENAGDKVTELLRNLGILSFSGGKEHLVDEAKSWGKLVLPIQRDIAQKVFDRSLKVLGLDKDEVEKFIEKDFERSKKRADGDFSK